jgi:hypothetical protein
VYRLEVHFPDKSAADHVEHVPQGADALARIEALLAEHHGCERIVVFHGVTRLFAVDCKGNTLAAD